MDRTCYVDECNRQLNDAEFYRKQDGDITNQIQERVTTYVQRMLKDGYIDKKTKQYLTATLQNASHNSSTLTLTLSSLPWIHTLKTPLTSLTNWLTSLLYQITPYLSLSTFRHCTPTSHTTMELTLAVVSLILVLTNTFLLRHIVTFYALYLP